MKDEGLGMRDEGASVLNLSPFGTSSDDRLFETLETSDYRCLNFTLHPSAFIPSKGGQCFAAGGYKLCHQRMHD